MDTHMLVLPHVLDVSVSFQPIHNFLPQKSISESPFILPHHDLRDGWMHPQRTWLRLGAQDKNEARLPGAGKLPVLANDFNTDSGEGGPPAPTVQTPEESAGINPANEINVGSNASSYNFGF